MPAISTKGPSPMTDTQTQPDPQERGKAACPACGGTAGDGTAPCAYAGCPKRGGASVDVDRLSQIKRRIREWRSYDAATQDDDQDWLVAEVERLQADLAQARAEQSEAYVRGMQESAEVFNDQLMRQSAELEQARAETEDLDRRWLQIAEEIRIERNQLGEQRDQARSETDDLVAKAWDAAKAGFDELRVENERLNEAVLDWQRRLAATIDERDQLRAENQALRGALKRIADGDTGFYEESPQGVALAALDGQVQP